MTTSKEVLNDIKEVLKYVVVGFIVGLIITNTLVKVVNVPSSSMEPNINSNSKLILSLVSYIKNDVNRGDIIVFTLGNTQYVKRVIGLPGDKVKCIQSTVYVNDIELEENYLTEHNTSDFEEVIVPSDSYFVLGDNRDNSFDSRYWNNPFVSKDMIIGKIIAEIAPKFRLLA